jgi:hypothetical protein
MTQFRDATLVRVYMTEHDKALEPFLKHLHDVANVKGVTVFRAIAGYGGSGRMHRAELVDLSLNLPLVIEFFDSPERIDAVLEQMVDLIEPGHVVSWNVRAIY